MQLSDARPFSRHARAIAVAIVLVVTFLVVAFSYAGASVVPVWDAWTWIAHAMHFAHGGMSEVLQKTGLNHADQVYALPSLIALAAGPLIDYSLRPFALLAATLVVGLGASCYWLCRRAGLDPIESAIVFAYVVTYRHYENLLLGFQFGVVLCVLAATLAIVAAGEWRGTRGIVAATLLALAATASSTGGIFAPAVVILMRAALPGKRLGALLTIVIAMALVVAFEYAIARLGLTPGSFVAHRLPELRVDMLPDILLDAFKLLGGAISGGKAASVIGIAVAAGSLAIVFESIARERRLNTLGGLALLSLLGALAIAAARSPFEDPASRHAIFASPAVAACGIRLFRSLRPGLRPLAVIATGVTAVLLQSAAAVDALAYRNAIDAWDQETRLALASMGDSNRLMPEEMSRVNPGPPAYIHLLMKFVRERGWAMFSPRYERPELDESMPEQVAGAATRTGGSSRASVDFFGPGYVFSSHPCRFATGCAVRLAVEASATGRATIGVIVRGTDGRERKNENTRITPAADPTLQVIRVTSAPDTLLEPYVFAFSASDRVSVGSFRLTIVERSPRLR